MPPPPPRTTLAPTGKIGPCLSPLLDLGLLLLFRASRPDPLLSPSLLRLLLSPPRLLLPPASLLGLLFLAFLSGLLVPSRLPSFPPVSPPGLPPVLAAPSSSVGPPGGAPVAGGGGNPLTSSSPLGLALPLGASRSGLQGWRLASSLRSGVGLLLRASRLGLHLRLRSRLRSLLEDRKRGSQDGTMVGNCIQWSQLQIM